MVVKAGGSCGSYVVVLWLFFGGFVVVFWWVFGGFVVVFEAFVVVFVVVFLRVLWSFFYGGF